MANSEHLEILSQGVKVWNRWRRENPTIKPSLGSDLQKVDLRGADLHYTFLDYANLEGADLAGASLRGAILHSANLRESNLQSVDLRKADLLHAHLQGAVAWECSFQDAVLRHANLSQTDLRGADLTGVDARRANFECAKITDASLQYSIATNASFKGADMRGALLQGADLRAATLTDADLSDAAFSATIINTVDLSQVKGLRQAHHRGASTIGTDTLETTAAGVGGDLGQQEQIEIFYRGAGVSEELIEMSRIWTSNPIEFYSCFISYSQKDKNFARQLYRWLLRYDIRCWLDEHQLLPGDDIYEEVDRAIRLWDKVLLCCSEDSLMSWWVDNEITTAFRKKQELMKERAEQLQGRKMLCLIPLDLDGFLLSSQWKSGKRGEVLSRLAADFIGWEQDGTKFEKELERLVKALRTDGKARTEAPEPKL